MVLQNHTTILILIHSIVLGFSFISGDPGAC